MIRKINRKPKTVCAYELGAGSAVEAELIKSGRIRLLPDGKYEIFSRESVNGSGEIASPGDFVKIDGEGYPYPNERGYFLENHRFLDADRYEQKPQSVLAWTADDEMCPEVEYLMDHKGLVINESDPEKYFTAPLWGTVESAPCDAVLVFYRLERDADGRITDADFNFVARDEFIR